MEDLFKTIGDIVNSDVAKSIFGGNKKATPTPAPTPIVVQKSILEDKNVLMMGGGMLAILLVVLFKK